MIGQFNFPDANVIGQFNFPDANIDARDHGGKKPIHMLSHKASERTRSKSGGGLVPSRTHKMARRSIGSYWP